MRRSRFLAGAGCLAIGVVFSVAPTGVSARSSMSLDSATGSIGPVSAGIISDQQFGGASGGLASELCEAARGDARGIDTTKLSDQNTLTFADGWLVDLDEGWKHSHPSNAIFTLKYYSGAWIVPDSERGLTDAVDRLVDWADAMPDTGEKSMASGWSESATTKRLRVAACLYGASQDSRLLAVAEELADAVMDPNRYYGPPRYSAHNHGVMADRVLLQASSVFNRPDWRATALERLRAQLHETFDSCGMVFEQASTYQHFSVELWSHLAEIVEPWNLTLADQINTAVLDAQRMADALTHPDGTVPVIGNGGLKTGTSYVTDNSRIWCAESGWGIQFINADDVMQHIITRFGPGTRFHGHEDKGSVVWWTGSGEVSAPVLVDRGLYGKNNDHRRAYAKGPEGHSTLLWDGGGNLRLEGTARSKKSARILTLRGVTRKHGSWTRVITAKKSATPSMRIVDKVRGKATRNTVTQQFPLHPSWKPLNRKKAIFVNDEGWKLKISCRNHESQGLERNIKLVEHYYAYSDADMAYTYTCTSPATSSGEIKLIGKLVVTPAG